MFISTKTLITLCHYYHLVLLSCHLGIQSSGNPLPKSLTNLWECEFDPRDLQNIRICKFRLEFLSYIIFKVLVYSQWWVPNKKKESLDASFSHQTHQHLRNLWLERHLPIFPTSLHVGNSWCKWVQLLLLIDLLKKTLLKIKNFLQYKQCDPKILHWKSKGKLAILHKDSSKPRPTDGACALNHTVARSMKHPCTLIFKPIWTHNI